MRSLVVSLSALLLLVGCGPAPDEPVDDGLQGTEDTLEQLPAALPDRLSETGLIVGGDVAADATSFEPRWPLWTDGYAKDRFLLLPPGTEVTTKGDGSYQFPLGARLAKTVWVEGERVETRVAYKLETGWTLGAYVWEGDDAVLAHDDTVVDGYEVPGRATCLTCHSSNPSPIGYSAWQLGDVAVPGQYAVRAGIGYLATHCGSCHREGGYAGATGLHLNLPTPVPSDVKSSPFFQTAVLRGLIIPGDPEGSLLFQRFTDEGAARMPPIGTNVMHDEGVASVRDLIDALAIPGRL